MTSVNVNVKAFTFTNSGGIKTYKGLDLVIRKYRYILFLESSINKLRPLSNELRLFTVKHEFAEPPEGKL